MSITLYEHRDFHGRKVVLTNSHKDLNEIGFNNQASSIKVASGTWVVYQHKDFGGKCYQVSKGSYDYCDVCEGIGNDTISSVKLVSDKITLFRDAGFKGTALPLLESVPNFKHIGFNDEASSVKVEQGNWTLFEHVDYEGKSMAVSPGSYDVHELREGVGNDVISSVKLNSAQILLYEHDKFEGRAVPVTHSTPSLRDLSFDDKISSIIVVSGKWSVHEHADYHGKSCELTKGSYDQRHISHHVGNDEISSVKLISY